jgi:hypothetical protein
MLRFYGSQGNARGATMSEQTASGAAPAVKPAILRSLVNRINTGEFDLGKKDFHQFVVKEIYPLLASGTLTVDDLERLTRAYAVRNDPYNKDEG